MIKATYSGENHFRTDRAPDRIPLIAAAPSRRVGANVLEQAVATPPVQPEDLSLTQVADPDHQRPHRVARGQKPCGAATRRIVSLLCRASFMNTGAREQAAAYSRQ